MELGDVLKASKTIAFPTWADQYTTLKYKKSKVDVTQQHNNKGTFRGSSAKTQIRLGLSAPHTMRVDP